LNQAIKKMSHKDESFNEFFKNFKAKNEQGFANVIDMTQAEQEDKLLQVTPEMRKNQMIMMDEFRRRKNLKDYHDGMQDVDRKVGLASQMDAVLPVDMKRASTEGMHKYMASNEERFFEPARDEIFEPRDFTVVFLDSDSVTNVTSLSRTNKRRVLIFIGNGNGLVSYGKGKAGEYEQAFDNAFKNARMNMCCLDINEIMTSPRIIAGRHNDFKIRIMPQETPNYWGNPTIWEMLKHTGFYHCRFVCVSRKRDPYSLVYGFFNAIIKNKSIDQIAMVSGKKWHRQAFINPTTNSQDIRTYITH
jgi:ribosomal protein S5